MVTAENNLEANRSLFTKDCFSSQIYSVQKSISPNCAQMMFSLDFDQTIEILSMKHPGTQRFLNNSIGLVKCSHVEIKPIGERILSNTAVNIVVDNSGPKKPVQSKIATSKASAEQHISTLSSSAKGLKLSASSSKAVTSFFGASSASKVAKPKAESENTTISNTTISNTTEPMNTYGKSNSAITQQDESPMKMKPETASADNSPAIEAVEATKKKKKQTIIDDDEDEEWNDEGSSVHVSKKAKGSGKKTITADEDGEEDMDVEPAAALETNAAQTDTAKTATELDVDDDSDSGEDEKERYT